MTTDGEAPRDRRALARLVGVLTRTELIVALSGADLELAHVDRAQIVEQLGSRGSHVRRSPGVHGARGAPWDP
jgi:hypothetical protein